MQQVKLSKNCYRGWGTRGNTECPQKTLNAPLVGPSVSPGQPPNCLNGQLNCSLQHKFPPRAPLINPSAHLVIKSDPMVSPSALQVPL